MNLFKLRMFICKLLIGSASSFDKEVEEAYKLIWPKHADEEENTKRILKTLLIRRIKNESI